MLQTSCPLKTSLGRGLLDRRSRWTAKRCLRRAWAPRRRAGNPRPVSDCGRPLLTRGKRRERVRVGDIGFCCLQSWQINTLRLDATAGQAGFGRIECADYRCLIPSCSERQDWSRAARGVASRVREPFAHRLGRNGIDNGPVLRTEAVGLGRRRSVSIRARCDWSMMVWNMRARRPLPLSFDQELVESLVRPGPVDQVIGGEG